MLPSASDRGALSRGEVVAGRRTRVGMRFPIDVVYLDRGKVVVHIEENLKPWRLAAVRMSAASVLELPGQTLNSTRTAVGDEIEITVEEAAQA